MSKQTEWTISVVVPVFNGGRTIRSAIEHLLCQSLSPNEIIVVDDGSNDETASILRTFGSQIRVLTQTNRGPASARNAGIRASSGNLIAFTDSDCFPDKNWLQEIVKGFHSSKIGGVGGTVRGASEGLIGEYIDLHGWMNPLRGSDGTTLDLVTANACFRGDLQLHFDERFRAAGGEDTELSVRLRSLGYEFAFVETAIVRHSHKRTIRDYCRNIANHGEGRYILDQLWPQHKWRADRRKEIVRSAAGFGTMWRFYRSYRRHHGRKRSVLFAFLDHCQYVARFWGYRRGLRNGSLRELGSQSRDPGTLVYSNDEMGSGSFATESLTEIFKVAGHRNSAGER